MKKNLLLIIAIFFVSFSTSIAQTELLNEDFESTPGDGSSIGLADWVNYIEVGTRDWISEEYDNNKYAQYSSYSSGEANVGWLVTPALDMSNFTDASFSFDVNVGYWTHAGLTVHISTDFDGSDVGAATWDDITSNFTIPTEPTGGYGEFGPAGTMDISSYVGNTAYIAFKYSGDDNAGETTTFQVDNVVVEGTMAVGEINESAVSIYPNPTSSTITVNNDNRISRLVISNCAGQTIMEMDDVNKTTELNVANFSNGIYFITLTEEKGAVKTTKFMKK